MEAQYYTCESRLYRLHCRVGDIISYQLGPACMQALANVTLGLERLERLQHSQETDSTDGVSMVSRDTQAAE